jgi:hypothetical protein
MGEESAVMSPGNAILLNGVMKTGNREIGFPGPRISVS